ncbi:ImmA/IrrE family metallo-endopeptidase [Euzebya sp.]|uniref:ImmA/IrrE family metallo-endopeptidase n=1 Tax=Euzebya sp. TaxID=1971409 RepID=UPI003510EF36
MASHLWGLHLGKGRIVINQGLPGDLQLFAFAHELAHVLLSRGRWPWASSLAEEWLADWFGHELLLPAQLLADLSGARAAPALTVAAQTARLGLGPALTQVGPTVICRTCGHRPHLAGCECFTVRARVRREGSHVQVVAGQSL